MLCSRLEIDPDKVPSPDDLRPLLFPSMFTLTADDQGFQFASREAFPAFNPVALVADRGGPARARRSSRRARRRDVLSR